MDGKFVGELLWTVRMVWRHHCCSSSLLGNTCCTPEPDPIPWKSGWDLGMGVIGSRGG